MRRRAYVTVLTCLAFVWAILWPEIARARDSAPPADPSLESAKQHFEAGRAAYNASDFPTAIREFKAAESLRPSPILSYNIGLANEKLGRRRVAVHYYKHYLDSAPTASNRSEVQGRIGRLENDIAAQPSAQVPERAQDDPPPPPQRLDSNGPSTVQTSADPYAGRGAPMTTAPPPRRRNLWWVWVIVGVGGALVVGAIIAAAVITTRNASNGTYEAARIDLSRLAPSRNETSRFLSEHGEAGTARPVDVTPVVQVRF